MRFKTGLWDLINFSRYYFRDVSDIKYIPPGKSFLKSNTETITNDAAVLQKNVYTFKYIPVPYSEIFWAYRYMYQDQDFNESIGERTVR